MKHSFATTPLLNGLKWCGGWGMFFEYEIEQLLHGVQKLRREHV